MISEMIWYQIFKWIGGAHRHFKES